MSLTPRREADEENISTIYNTGFYNVMNFFSFCFVLFFFNTVCQSCFSILELYALSTHCFPIDSMNKMDRGAVASTSADNGISMSSNVKHPARRSRICKKCSQSVKNLSHHQQEVHGMSKMQRKLDGYLTGEKKAPNRRVKFCPLLPYKRSRTPIFQLDKHLQSGVHNLK